MVKGMYKSRTFRRVPRKTPGGRVVLHHVLRKPKKAHCGACGDVLKGVARERPSMMQNMPKTMKRPERPFGGVLCSKCLRLKIKKETRK
jgi:large subunit ribosomal protein L34e